MVKLFSPVRCTPVRPQRKMASHQYKATPRKKASTSLNTTQKMSLIRFESEKPSSIGVSESYSSPTAAKNGIASVMKNGLSTVIKDLTL